MSAPNRMPLLHRRLLKSLACLVFLATASPVHARPDDLGGAGCSGAWSTEGSRGHSRVFLPSHDLFEPPVADQKEPRLSLGYRLMDFRDQALPSAGLQSSISSGVVSAGAVFGFWRQQLADGCTSVQLSLFGGVFSQFNLDTPERDLMNTDFVIGLQATGRRGRFSGRLRAYHQSSHLGDGFLVHNPSVDRVVFGFQGVEGLASAEGSWWRVYGGAGYLRFTVPGGPGLLHAGADVRNRQPVTRRASPLVAVDVESLQARHWGTTTSVAAGVEWGAVTDGRRLRTLLVFRDGYTPYSQYSNTQRVRNVGVQVQFEF